MKEYKICNMRVEKDGAKIGGYIIKRVAEYEERIKHFYKSNKLRHHCKWDFVKGAFEEREWEEPAQYGSHQVTAVATPVGEENNSVFSENKKGIYDICLLYNFFTGQNACLEEDIYRFTHRNKMGTKLDKKYNVSRMVLGALEEIYKEEWRTDKKDKEILSFLFLLDGRDPKGLQIRFIEEWVCLEILGIHGERTQLFDVFKEKIKLFNEIDFKYCLKIFRNNYVHDGKCNLHLFKKGLNYYIKKKNPIPISNKFKKFINFVKEKDFGQFRINTWGAMDYLLSCVFIKIFGIGDKIDEINKRDFEAVNEYFNIIYL